MHDLTSKYVPSSGKFNPNLAFLENEIKNYRYLCMPGGTRSGKTYSAIQWNWRNLDRYTGVKYSVVRATLPSLKATVREDFIEIGTSCGLYKPSNHNLTDNIYRHNGNIVDFFSSDDDEKVRGRKRDVLYLNEAPELEWDIVKQMLWRTTSKVIIDYNPSYPESWVYDNILTRSDCAFITTTYMDNPYLTQGQLGEIEWMRLNDPDAYLVYGLGQRGQLRGQIYKNWKKCKELPADLSSCYVIDFGFSNDVACIAEFKKHNRALYGKEHIYKTGLNNLNLAIHLHLIGCTDNSVIIADSAEPKSIAELRQGYGLTAEFLTTVLEGMGLKLEPVKFEALKKALARGFMVLPAKKGRDSIDAGIQRVKQYEVLITEESHNAWNESRAYRWAEDPKTGQLLNEPIDKHNHFCDCVRMYAMAEGLYH